LLVDLNYYHTSYTNFIGQATVVSKASTTHRGEQINAGSIWSLYANSAARLTSDGFGLELTYNLPNNFVAKGNYSYATFNGEQPPGFITGFNTPGNRINLGISNTKLTEKLGFNINVSY
jgi:hypothetical protein